MLLLKRHLVDLVRRGKKQQTVRLWSRPLLRVGQISYTPGLGKMKITAVDQLDSLDALTEADAVADGFESPAALRAEIRKIYGVQIGNRKIYRIRFEWPIDDAGRKLVIQGGPEKTSRAASFGGLAAQRVSGGTSRIERPRDPSTAKRRSRSMSAAQRQQLRRFIVANTPPSGR